MIREGDWEKFDEEFPGFRDWGESWHDNLNNRAWKTQDHDHLAILDFERAEEHFNHFLK